MKKITKRSEPTNQAQAKINILKGLQTYLNDLKSYLTTYEGFKVRLIFGINEEHCEDIFLLQH